MQKHTAQWFERQERWLNYPFRATRIYYLIPTFIFIAVFFATKDYYHGWKQLLFSFLDISIFFRWRWSWVFFTEVVLWLVGLIIQIVALVFMIRSFAFIAQCRYLIRKAKEQSYDYMGRSRAITIVAPPGYGKTFSGAANFAIAVAAQQWAKLENDYLASRGMRTHWLKLGQVEKLTELKALEESYLFYKEREADFIPCLVSTIGIEDLSGRHSYKLTPETLEQKKRLAEYTVLLNDESGVGQGADRSKEMNDNERDFWRFHRHFGDFIIINTEQGGTGNAIQIRRVTDHNTRLSRQEWIMKPEFALKWHNRAMRRYLKRLAKGKLTEERAKYESERLYYRKRILETIGFRSIPYRYEAVESNAVDLEQGVYIFPARGFGNYEGRAFREQYKAREFDLDMQGWETSLFEEGGNLHAFEAKKKKRK